MVHDMAVQETAKPGAGAPPEPTLNVDFVATASETTVSIDLSKSRTVMQAPAVVSPSSSLLAEAIKQVTIRLQGPWHPQRHRTVRPRLTMGAQRGTLTGQLLKHPLCGCPPQISRRVRTPCFSQLSSSRCWMPKAASSPVDSLLTC